MPHESRTLRYVPDLEVSAVRRIVRTGLALAGLLFLLGLLAVLPGIDRLLAGLAVSLEALGLAPATALVVGAFLWVAPAVEQIVESSLDGPTGAVADAAASAKLLMRFVAVIVAYRGFALAATPTFRAFDLGGVYHLGFLVLGLAVLAALTRRLYHCWGPVTTLATEYVLDATSDGTREDTVVE